MKTSSSFDRSWRSPSVAATAFAGKADFTMPAATTRRQWLIRSTAIAAAALGVPASVAAHNDAGRVSPPLSAPALPITWHNGQQSSLSDALQGRVTALQTMFTSCSSICPIQGALFAQVQALLPPQLRQLQLLSLTIDPLSDDPRTLNRWLTHFSAQAKWRAGAPNYRSVDGLLDFLRARSSTSDRHTAQVYLFNAKGELVLRTTDFPPPEQIAGLLSALAVNGKS